MKSDKAKVKKLKKVAAKVKPMKADEMAARNHAAFPAFVEQFPKLLKATKKVPEGKAKFKDWKKQFSIFASGHGFGARTINTTPDDVNTLAHVMKKWVVWVTSGQTAFTDSHVDEALDALATFKDIQGIPVTVPPEVSSAVTLFTLATELNDGIGEVPVIEKWDTGDLTGPSYRLLNARDWFNYLRLVLKLPALPVETVDGIFGEPKANGETVGNPGTDRRDADGP